jgi:glutamate---cysteine ligase / carboxylate-amine ligase
LPHASQETHAAVIELATGIHPDVSGVVAELASLRNRLASELDAMGLAVAAAGTHALTLREETQISDALRYGPDHAEVRPCRPKAPSDSVVVA